MGYWVKKVKRLNGSGLYHFRAPIAIGGKVKVFCGSWRICTWRLSRVDIL